jgi:GAF domain-containing protein
VVRVDSTDADDRWPEFLDAARAHGIHSSLSLPLLVAGDGIGALNLYAEPPSRFSDSSEVVGQAIAAHAAVAVANGIAYWEKVTLAEQLETALTSRAIIEQAKGVIIATTGRSAEEAFVLLREQSQAQNVKLRDVAAEIVERQQRRT